MMQSASQKLPRRDGPLISLPPEEVEAVVRRALAEDLGGVVEVDQDLTTAACVSGSRRATARLVAREAGVMAGGEIFTATFCLLDSSATVEVLRADGERFERGEMLASVSCQAAALLVAERTALNFSQRLCGVATRTAEFVARAGGKARVLDTRKTTPGLRLLERHAVRCGGGENHRFGLSDEVMIKDNHLDLSGRSLEEVVQSARAAVPVSLCVTVEARDVVEARAAIQGGADVVMLDNIEPQEMSAMLEELRALVGERPVEFEASGGVNLDTIAVVAACGVDRVSVGALTHSAPAIDLALEVEL
jgi:nicotinate-nucleotide pyrophosphorylase (carboxylating)